MNQKIDQKSEFSNSFIRWLVLWTYVTIFIFLYLNFNLENQPWFTILPWLSAGKLTVKQGIEAFSGGIKTGLASIHYYQLLAGVLIGFVLGPTLILYNWRKFQSEKKPTLWISNIAFIIGGIISFSIIIITIPALVYQVRTFNGIKNTDNIRENKELLLYDLNRVSARAYEYWILPKDLGGGENSYENYYLPPQITSDENGTFQITGKSKYRIGFKAISGKYDGAVITAEMDSDGKLRNFNYEGIFQ